MTVTFYKLSSFTKMFPDFFADPKILYASLSPKFNRDMVFKAGEGAGRSGSFFFFSHDRKFIIKTMTTEERDLLLKLIPAMEDHFEKNPTSILAKIVGVFTVNTPHLKNVHIMCMENTLRLKNPDELKYVFDLKGSTVDRKVKGKTKRSTTLKDENFLIAAKHHEKFVNLKQHKSKIKQAVLKDV